MDRTGISGYVYALVSVLSVAVPVLFLGAMIGLRTQLPPATRPDFASSLGVVGLVMGCFGAILGTVGALGLKETAITDWWWWVLLLEGLMSMGLAVFLKGGRRLLGAVVSISAALGWASLLTDPAFSGVLVPMRPVHVACAAAFCIGSVTWGAMLVVPQEGH